MFERVIILFHLLIFVSTTYAQKPGYQTFENINLSAEASVACCFLQDNLGMIWIGSDKGLFSYDGYSSKQHFIPENTENVRINCGVIVRDSFLYLGADNGIHIYNYHTDRYEENKIKFPSDVRAMLIHNNILWIGSHHGLYSYDIHNKQLKAYPQKDNPGLTHETIYSLIHSTDGIIYIGTYDGLCKYNPEERLFEKIPLPASIYKKNQFINSLLEDTLRNCIWIGTEGNLFQYFPKTGKCRIIDKIHDNSVKSLVLDETNQLLVATDNGLYIYNENEPLQHILHDSRNNQSLSNNIVWNIFRDKDENIWLGTDYGISLSRFNRTFQYIPISQVTGTGEGNHFYAIFKDSEEVFWLGGTNGIIRFDGLKNSEQSTVWYKMGDAKFSLSHNRIRQIYEDRDKHLWIATDGSISRYDRESGRFIQYNIIDSTGTYNSNWAYNIWEDEKGKLWIATCLGGIFVVDKQRLIESTDRTYIADNNISTANGLSGMFINQLIPDKQGNIWVLLYNNAVDKIHIASGEVKQVPIHEMIGKKNPYCATTDRDGNIWAGFRGGLLFINPANDNYQVISLGEFSNSEVLSIAEVEEHIWITTTDGIRVVHKTGKNIRRLNLMNRIFSSIFFDKTDRIIYMGSVDGFAVISPDAIMSATEDYPIYITNMRINNLSLLPDETVTNNENSIRYAREITLNHKQNNLYFEVSDLPYMLDEKNKFVYRLEDFDANWHVLPPGSNQISFSNLEFGKYRLLVSKLDENGKPSLTNQTTVDILIKAPWYYTKNAKLIYFLLLISLIAWIINFFRVKNRLKIERIEKEKIMEQSRSKIDFFTNMSHELKTPLSMIISPVSNLLLETKDQQQKYHLEIVQRNAMKLNSLIHQVLDVNRIDNDVNSGLILSKIELVSFAQRILAVYQEEVTKEKNIHFNLASDVEHLYMEADQTKLESILNNLLSNAFKYTNAGGNVALSLSRNTETEQVEITVSDTGIGIPEKDIPYIFQRFFQSSKTSGKKEGTGIGLYLVKTYAELHGGNVRIASGENKGTTIRVSLPLRAAESAPLVKDENIQNNTEKTDQPLILIVEDNPEIAEFICHILKAMYCCRIAVNGKIGFDLATQLLPDLIVTDLMMPVMDGLEMSRQLKKNVPTSTIPIILLTAKDDKQTELESIQQNINFFIPKPFEADILLSRIEQLLISKQQMETKTRIEMLTTPKNIDAVSQDEKFLATITGIIEDRVSDPDLNVNALVDISGINSKQLYRKVKQLTGTTPVEYIKSIRLKKAAMLLEQKKFTVAEVMYMVGYSSHSYFSKCFLSEFGKTPKQFIEEA